MRHDGDEARGDGTPGEDARGEDARGEDARGEAAAGRGRQPRRGGLGRPPRDLPVSEMREQLASYIYGNITVLGATIAVSPHQVHDGMAIWAVLATGLLTFLAHVLAHIVGQSFGREEDEHSGDTRRAEALRVIIGARPIATSAVLPALVYLAAWLEWIPADWAQTAALGVLAVRIALVGPMMQRYSDRGRGLVGLLGGVFLAAVAFGIGMLKVVLTH